MYLRSVQTIHRGNAAEAAVIAALEKAGIRVMIPFGQGHAFDLAAVIPPDGDIVRIQVKSGRIRKGCVEFTTCSTDHGRGAQPYDGRAEVIAVHVPEPDMLLMVPVEICPRSKGNLRAHPPRNNQRRGIRFAADYTFDMWVRSIFAGLD